MNFTLRVENHCFYVNFFLDGRNPAFRYEYKSGEDVSRLTPKEISPEDFAVKLCTFKPELRDVFDFLLPMVDYTDVEDFLLTFGYDSDGKPISRKKIDPAKVANKYRIVNTVADHIAFVLNCIAAEYRYDYAKKKLNEIDQERKELYKHIINKYFRGE